MTLTNTREAPDAVAGGLSTTVGNYRSVSTFLQPSLSIFTWLGPFNSLDRQGIARSHDDHGLECYLPCLWIHHFHQD